jgi:glycosyltransferase involved in cell wall biosynthesis
MPKVSIIVPIYKAEKYLSHCVESILIQTYVDWELLLVDDGSPDRSGIICEEYAAKDTRIRVFHKENSGVSSARNVGLDNAKGEWVMFVDADDWIEPQCIDTCLKAVVKEKLDMVQFNYRMIDEEGKFFMSKTINIPAMDNKKYIERNSFNVCVWGALFARFIITNNNIRFNEEIKLAEDQLFIMTSMIHASRIAFIKESLYNYLQIDTSAVHNSKTKDILKSMSLLNDFKQSYPIFNKHIIYQNNQFCYQLVIDNELSIKEICKLYNNTDICENSLRAKLLYYPYTRNLLYYAIRLKHKLWK